MEQLRKAVDVNSAVFFSFIPLLYMQMDCSNEKPKTLLGRMNSNRV